MAVKEYPNILGEYETVAHCLEEGASLARFGDGEVKLMEGGAQIREPANERLGAELRRVIADPDPRCIVGVPTLNPRGPKIRNWNGRAHRFLPFMSEKVPYYSAFVSRPDSAPWIATHAYANMVQDLWIGKSVALVCEPDNKLHKCVKQKAAKLKHITCPHTQTFAVSDKIEEDIIRGRFEIAILSCGPAATVMANRLAKRGVQTIDLGSIGGMLLKLLELEPLGDLRTCTLRRPDDMTVDQMKRKLNEDWDMLYFDEKER